MRKTSLFGTAIAGVLGLVVLFGDPVLSQAPVPPAAEDCTSYAVNTPVTADLVAQPMLPPCAPSTSTAADPSHSVDFKDPIDNQQHGFDLYSWLTFLALNSPADGTPIGKTTGGDAPAIWESYKQLPEVMREKGERPTDWGQPTPLPDACRGVASQGRMVVYVIEEAFDEPFRSGPLIDQNGNYALFMILMNKQMFNFILDNKLYSRQGQGEFPQSVVDFPMGNNRGQTAAKIGAVMIKASWKVLGPGDDPKTFHTLDALVYIPKRDNPKSEATCAPKKLGLIGFHVGHKAQFAPQWVWTTFEHVRNVPEQKDVTLHRNLLSHYNFYDPACDTTKCPVNMTPPPPTPWDPRVQPFPNGFKSQIVRVIPVTDDVVKINALSQSVAGLKGTVWENYMLVSTQWPTDFANINEKTGVPAPTYLPNSTLETFSQGEVPLASSSCIACHLNATTNPNVPAGKKKEAIASDFTYILEKAQ
jgi:hypothetical protein